MLKLIVGSVLVCLSWIVGASDDKVVTGYSADKVAEHTYVIHGPTQKPTAKNKGFMNNPGFVLTTDGVVVIDPGSSKYTGEMVVSEVAKMTQLPIVAIFNTHVHGDHWLGNHGIAEAFPQVKIYAHDMTIQLISEGVGEQWVANLSNLTNGATDGTKVVPATIAVEDAQVIEIGGIDFKIHHKGQAHSITDIMIEVVQDKTLFLGDNGVVGRIVRMKDASFKGNIAILQHAIDLNLAVYVPGHGATGDVNVAKLHHEYLDVLFEQVKILYEEDVSDFDMKATIHPMLTKFHTWVSYEDEVGKHISLAYLEAENDAF